MQESENKGKYLKLGGEPKTVEHDDDCENKRELVRLYIYIYIIVLPLAFMASLFVDELRSRQPFERMYVNNRNYDS